MPRESAHVARERELAAGMDRIVRHLIEKNISISTMESCTSGLIASYLTDTEGASAILKGAFITYSNEAKIRQGVPAEVIARCGVYSMEVAREMAQACRRAYGADIGIGVTGTTGNLDPENADSVAGEVYYAVVWGERSCVRKRNLDLTGLTRHESKIAIACEVAEALGEVLSPHCGTISIEKTGGGTE